MPCFSPLTAYQTESGEIIFAERGKVQKALKLPCGQCIGCRLERSRQWAVRCMHEAQMHDENWFVTLTYDDENLPETGSLVYRDFQQFMRRLRKKKGKVRFYMCGEYGEQGHRPHYHACMFGLAVQDLEPIGECLFQSAELQNLWGKGFVSLGELTFDSAAYVARYCMKKVTGSAAREHYSRVNLSTGEVVSLTPEFARMSLKPGIGATWFQKFHRDVYPHDYVVTNGHEAKPPRYYDKLLGKMNPFEKDYLEVGRNARAQQCLEDGSPERLEVRRVVAEAALKQKQRRL